VKLGRTEAWVAIAREFHHFAVNSHQKYPGLWRREIE